MLRTRREGWNARFFRWFSDDEEVIALKTHLFVTLALLAGACSMVPQDPDETLDRIREEGAFNVGVVARGSAASDAEMRFLAQVGEAASARPVVYTGAAETLLSKLEDGELDLVLGEFHSSTPWATRVTFVPPLTKAGDDVIVVSAAAPNGENEWISLLHGKADLLGGGQ